MSDKPSETFQEGVKAGLEGKSNDDNPHSRGVIDSIIGAGIAVSTGTLVDPIAEADKAAGEWKAGRDEGERLSEEKNK